MNNSASSGAPLARGAPTFFNVGTSPPAPSTTRRLERQRGDDRGRHWRSGDQLQHVNMPTSAPVSRPFGLARGNDGGTGDEHWNFAPYSHGTATRGRCSRPTTRTAVGATGSGLVKLVDPGAPARRATYVVVNGIDKRPSTRERRSSPSGRCSRSCTRSSRPARTTNTLRIQAAAAGRDRERRPTSPSSTSPAEIEIQSTGRRMDGAGTACRTRRPGRSAEAEDAAGLRAIHVLQRRWRHLAPRPGRHGRDAWARNRRWRPTSSPDMSVQRRRDLLVWAVPAERSSRPVATSCASTATGSGASGPLLLPQDQDLRPALR
jgi:hypothetical protein